MKVRIRFGRGVHINKKHGKNRHVALASAALLVPAAMMCGSLAVWRLASDMQIASEFAITSGIFSHWLVWLGLAVLLVCAAIRLNRYGAAPPERAPNEQRTETGARAAG